MTRKIGTGTYKPSGSEKPRWVPVFESNREEPRSSIALPDWNFSVSSAHDVRVVDDRSGLGHDHIDAVGPEGLLGHPLQRGRV